MIKKLENRRVKEKIIYSEVFASEMSSLGFGHALSFVCMCSQAFVLLFVTRWNYMFYSVPFKFSISCVYFLFFLNLIHCISFAKHQNESTTGIHVLPNLNPPLSSLQYSCLENSMDRGAWRATTVLGVTKSQT